MAYSAVINFLAFSCDILFENLEPYSVSPVGDNKTGRRLLCAPPAIAAAAAAATAATAAAAAAAAVAVAVAGAVGGLPTAGRHSSVGRQAPLFARRSR